MNLQTLAAAQVSKEVPINENFEVLDWATVYAKDATTSSGLTWGYFGGRWSGTLISAGTLALTGGSPTTVNYIVVNRSTGAISVSTTSTNWDDTANYARVYKVTASGSAVESTEDHRAGLHGVIGGVKGDTGASGAISNVAPGTFEARLTLETGVAISTSDQLAKTTVYLTPHKGNTVALYDNGSPNGWFGYSLAADISIAVPATTLTNYDVFVYSNAGTLTLEAVAWTNDTTRATALTKQNGVYVKTGETNKRYVGSFRTTNVSGETEDSAGGVVRPRRFLWNYYHRTKKAMRKQEQTDSWTYSAAAWRQTNSGGSPDNDANELQFLIGVNEDSVSARAQGLAATNTTAAQIRTGIGLDSTTTNSAQIIGFAYIGTAAGGTAGIQPANAFYEDRIAEGYHRLTWLEYANGSNTQTWYGDNGAAANTQQGILGEVWG
jgi:hypothetical protein